MVLRCYGIPCFNYFLLSTSGEKGQGQSEKLPWLLRKFFESAIGHSLFKACSQQLWVTLTAVFWKTLLTILRIWINIRASSLWSNYHETNIDDIARIVAQKSEFALQRTFHRYKTWHFTYFYALLFLSNKPKFYI